MTSTSEESFRNSLPIVSQACAALGEHFDSVQIFVCKHDGGEKETHTYNAGLGCWNARYGQVREWLVMKEAMMKRKAEKDVDDDEEK